MQWMVESMKYDVRVVYIRASTSIAAGDYVVHIEFRGRWATSRWLYASFPLICSFSHCFQNVKCADGGGKHHHQQPQNSFYAFNSFETMNNTKITAQIGGTAILPCIVEASSPATVTWIRRSDYRLLTGLSSRNAFFSLIINSRECFRSRPNDVQQRRQIPCRARPSQGDLGSPDQVGAQGRRGRLRVQSLASSAGINFRSRGGGGSSSGDCRRPWRRSHRRRLNAEIRM